MKRFYILLILILLGLAALLYFFRLQAGTYLFTRILEQAGAEHVELEIATISGKEIAFSRADCTIQGTRLSLQNGSFSWNRAALAGKRLDTIALDTLTVKLPAQNQSQAKKKITVEQVRRQLEQIRKELPFHTLIIKHLVLDGSAAGVLAGRDLSLKLVKKEREISGALAFTDQHLALILNSAHSAQWNLDLQKSGQIEPFFSARLKLRENPVRVEIQTDLARLDRLNTLLNKPLPKMAGKLAGTLTLSLKKETKADLVLDLQQPEFAATKAKSARITLHGRMDAAGKLHLEDQSGLEISGLQKENLSSAAVTIGLDGIFEHIKGDWQFTYAPESTWIAAGLKAPGLTLQSVKIVPAMTAILSRKKIALDLKPEWHTQVSGIQSGSLSMAETALQLKNNVHITVALNEGPAWNVGPSRWQWTIKKVQQQDLSIDPDPISINIEQLAGSPENLQIKADLTCGHLELSNKENGLALQQIRAEFTAEGGKIAGTASCAPETVPGTLAIRFSHHLKNGHGQAFFTSKQPLSFSALTPLSSLLNQWPLAFDLTGGSLQAGGSISWRPGQPLRVILQAELSEGKGHYQEILFSGMEIRQDLQLLPRVQSRKSGSVGIDTLKAGITVKNITMETAFTPSPHGKLPQIIVRNLSASLFGGTVSDDFFSYDPQQPEVHSTIQLNNIDLARLITVQQVKGLKVKGRIEGSLPFFFDRNGLRMDKGDLKNTGKGGLIQYTLAGDNALKKSPLTGYALKALEEFHYSLLSATAQYRPDGELQVSLHLEGKSPKLDTTRPVHLNINAEQNLLSLLKSLRYSTSLTDEIDREVQQHYQD